MPVKPMTCSTPVTGGAAGCCAKHGAAEAPKATSATPQATELLRQIMSPSAIVPRLSVNPRAIEWSARFPNATGLGETQSCINPEKSMAEEGMQGRDGMPAEG